MRPDDAGLISALLHHQVGAGCAICDKVRAVTWSAVHDVHGGKHPDKRTEPQRPRGGPMIRSSLQLNPAEIECLEVFADGSVEMLGDHSRSVMAKMMLDIAKRAKG